MLGVEVGGRLRVMFMGSALFASHSNVKLLILGLETMLERTDHGCWKAVSMLRGI